MRKDHFKHLIAGYIIALSTAAGLVLFITPGAAMLAGIAAGIATGAAKEIIWDSMLKKGTPEISDFYYTAIGSLAAGLPQLIQLI